MCLPLRSELPCLLKTCSWKRWTPLFTCHVTARDSWRGRVPQTLWQGISFCLASQHLNFSLFFFSKYIRYPLWIMVTVLCRKYLLSKIDVFFYNETKDLLIYLQICPAQSSGAAEYTDCISAVGYNSPSTCVLDMALNNLMVWLQFWRFGDYGVLFHFHCSQVRSDLEW